MSSLEEAEERRKQFVADLVNGGVMSSELSTQGNGAMVISRFVTTICETCRSVRHTKEPCIACHGSRLPAREKCETCFSFRGGICNRLECDVKASWTGCTLHCPKEGKK